MNWVQSFEVMCYTIVAALLVDMARRRDVDEVWLFISATFAGLVLELLAVRVTGIYHYSKDFLVNVGFEPYQFPLFGGLMWGGLSVCGLRIARRLRVGRLHTALVAGWLIVSMDLMLDVVAIRLDGGFWVWDGRPITLDVNHHLFMSVIWVNFLGYLSETPAVVYATLRWNQGRSDLSFARRFGLSLAIGALGIAFVGVASGASLALNAVTDEWFACLAFAALWVYLLFVVMRAAIDQRLRMQVPGTWDVSLVVFWGAMYGYCLVALWHLGIAAAAPWFAAAGVALAAGTLWLATAQ